MTQETARKQSVAKLFTSTCRQKERHKQEDGAAIAMTVSIETGSTFSVGERVLQRL